MSKIILVALLLCCLAGNKLYAQPPAPGFTGSTTICTGTSTTVTANGQTGATFRWWDAPTGGNLRSSSPGYTIPVQNTTGSYRWYVEQTTGGLTSPRTEVVITVNQTPTLSISPASPAVCAGSSISLIASGATTYVWTPGNGNGSTFSVNPTVNTTYTVTGTTNGCSASATRTVAVNKTTASTDVTICPGNTTTLTASGATNYTWNPGNLSGNSVNVSPTVTTTYIVSGTGAGCTTTDTVLVTVRPVIGLTAGSNATVPEGSIVQLICSSALPATYAWTPNNGSSGILSGDSVYVVPTQTTTYTVTSTDQFNCNATATSTITLSKLASVAANTTICNGTAATLAATGTGPFTWYDAASGGSLLFTGASFNTGNLSTNRSYWVADNGGARKQMTVSVIGALSGVTATPSSICRGMHSRLQAPHLGLVRWYDAPTGGNLLGTTTSDTSLLVTPTASSTYYAEGVSTPITHSFSYTGNIQTWTVPPGVFSINIDAYGSAGERLNNSKAYIGKGGRVQATMNVTPGQVLHIYVGGKNQFNGGGSSVASGTFAGSRGGDATDIRIGGTALINRVLVAGGGGGTGRTYNGTDLNTNQGHGGGLSGQAGGVMNVGSGPSYGGGGTQSDGGSGGIMNGLDGNNAGLAGTFGQGGRSGSYSSQHTGGAGGSGWYGGGGGTASGDGGGGSSYTNPILCYNVVHTQGSWDDIGILFISYGISCGTTARTPVTVNVQQALTPIVSDTLANGCGGSAIALYATGLAPSREVGNFDGTQPIGPNGNGGGANITTVANNFTMDFWVKPGSTITHFTPSTSGTSSIAGQRFCHHALPERHQCRSRGFSRYERDQYMRAWQWIPH